MRGLRAAPVLRPAATSRGAKPGGPSWCPCVLTSGRSQGEGHVRSLCGQTTSWSRSFGAVRPPAQVATVTHPESCARSDAVPAPLLRGARPRALHAAAQRRSVSAAAFREGRSRNRHRPLLPAAPAVPAAPQRLPGLSAFTFGRCLAGCRILDWQFFLSVRQTPCSWCPRERLAAPSSCAGSPSRLPRGRPPCRSMSVVCFRRACWCVRTPAPAPRVRGSEGCVRSENSLVVSPSGPLSALPASQGPSAWPPGGSRPFRSSARRLVFPKQLPRWTTA